MIEIKEHYRFFQVFTKDGELIYYQQKVDMSEPNADWIATVKEIPLEEYVRAAIEKIKSNKFE